MSIWSVVMFLAVALDASSMQANLTGNWRLNIDKSDWGTKPKPLSVVLSIEHKEPILTYSGSVMYAGEDTRDFGFFGAIDGKPYTMARSFGNGTAVLRRIDSTTFDSVFRSTDGAYTETSRTTVSRDGKTLTRKLRLQTPEGTRSWTEVYERR